jgi:hypothetical protein
MESHSLMFKQDQIITRQDLTHQLAALQEATTDRPYSIPHRLRLAKVYKQLGYPDLAASDAYKALLLIDEVVEEGEYHEEAIEAARDDYISEVLAQLSVEEENESKGEEGAVRWAETVCSITAYVSNRVINGRSVDLSD